MDFSWSDEQKQLRDSVIDFAQNKLTLTSHTHGNSSNGSSSDLNVDKEARSFPMEAWKQCAEFGMQGLYLPKEYGGRGHDRLTTVLALESFGYACSDPALSYALSAQMWSLQPALLYFGNESQKHDYLAPLLKADRMGAFAMTEPESGSDTAHLQTHAKKQGDHYIINGTKAFITFGPIADFAVVFASTKPELGAWGTSAFIIDRGTPGFTQSKAMAKLGLHGIPLGELTFDQCKVHESKRLGAEGVGMSLFAKVMESERAFILSAHVGDMARQLEQSTDFAKSRKQFGKPIGKNQSVANRLVEMKLRLEMAKLMVYKAAWLYDTGQPLVMEASLAKLHISESFVASSLDAIRTFGARGYLAEYAVGEMLNDAVGSIIYGGTPDIQRIVIARLLGL